MRSPIHVKCARSGELCEECKRKLESGEYSNLDVKLTAILSRIEERHKLREIIFVRGIDTQNIVYILVKSDVSELIGKGGRVLKEIKTELGKKVRIVNVTNEKRAIKDIIFPARPRYISQVFSPLGNYLKIVIPKQEMGKLPTNPRVLEAIIKKIIGKDVKIVLE